MEPPSNVLPHGAPPWPSASSPSCLGWSPPSQRPLTRSPALRRPFTAGLQLAAHNGCNLRLLRNSTHRHARRLCASTSPCQPPRRRPGVSRRCFATYARALRGSGCALHRSRARFPEPFGSRYQNEICGTPPIPLRVLVHVARVHVVQQAHLVCGSRTPCPSLPAAHLRSHGVQLGIRSQSR